VGNVTPTVTDSIVYDTTPPAGTLLIAAGADYANSASVTLTNGASDVSSGVADARFSNDGVAWSAWGAYAPTSAWTLETGEGTRTVYAQYRDGAGNVSGTTSDTIVIETGPPTGSVVIAGGPRGRTSATDAHALRDRLDLRRAGHAVQRRRFGLDRVAELRHERCVDPSAGDGPKTVHAQFRDGAGNVSEPVSDGISVDTVPPTGHHLDRGATRTSR